MNYGSVCSGIEAATVAWEPLGWKASWYAEIEPFPSQLLAHHYPEVRNLGDMTKIADMVMKNEIDAPDVLVGGTPCQAFSIAGLRNSLDDDRGQLSLAFVRLANEIDSTRSIRGLKPAIIAWENVPGVLNTKDNAFGCFLGALSGEECELQPPGGRWKNAGCVFGPSRQVAWRVLDAQYFGLPQRRKRVFVIASARTECAAEVLFERKSMFGDIKKGGSQGEGSTACSKTNFSQSGKAIGVGGLTVNAAMSNELFPTLLARKEADGYVVHGTQDPIISCEIAHCLGRNNGQENVLCQPAYAMIADTTPKISKEINSTLRSNGGGGIVPSSVTYQSVARYITEVECERLQGFPDGYTNIPGASKGKRYKSLGNSMAVPVMRWIADRIKQVYGGGV